MTGQQQNPFSFAGQKAVVIAGSRGIGKGIADLIVQLGGQVRRKNCNGFTFSACLLRPMHVR